MNSLGVRADSTKTVEEATERGGLVEVLKDECELDRLLILAPHGGKIEPFTSVQAQMLYDLLWERSLFVTLWMALGFDPGGSAYKRYHVPSTEFATEDFPKLGELLADERSFAFAVSLHGTAKDWFVIGGTASQETKQEAAEAIRRATHDSFGIQIANNGDRMNGMHPENIANRLARQSLQLEQPKLARRDYGEAIVHALADFLATRG